MFLLEDEALSVKNVFGSAMGMGYSEPCLRANARNKKRKSPLTCQNDDTDFSGLLWRWVSGQLL